jgi:lysophospholipase L1-like esterase
VVHPSRLHWLVRLVTPVAVLVLVAVGVLQAGRLVADFRRGLLRSSSFALPVREDPPAAILARTLPTASPAPEATRAPTAAAPAPATGPGGLAGIGRIVALGDSVPAGSSCDCTAYPRLVARRIAAATGHPVTSTNLAVGGSTSQDVLDDLTDPQVRDTVAGSDLVVVEIGANDLDADPAGDADCLGPELPCYRAALAAVTARIAEIARSVRSLQGEHGHLALIGYWNVFLDGAVGRAQGSTYVSVSDALTRGFNEAVAQLAADQHAVYVDLYRPFKGDGSRDPTALLAADGDHPDAAGHAVIADSVVAALAGSAPGAGGTGSASTAG